MKYTINQITSGEDEAILNYIEMNEEVARIVAFFKSDSKKIIGWKDKIQIVIRPEEILYIESVDGRTFAYTEQDVYKVNFTLAQLEELLKDISFYRCSKSMIMNIDRVANLKSLSSNRIDAVMQNGEHIMISRTYATEFRRILRGEH
ncbi:MAG: LytTR family transcriptional regulator DNA-binding domain-containing protein [Lachnospiraceae bacterium]|nr:LytTR family transcriptional regulator DNA-binding domain-containing protein [Lachnospiraceae bacterium]